MNQKDWIDLLRQDQLTAVTELLNQHVKINDKDVKSSLIFLRRIVPKSRRNKTNEILSLVDAGLSAWFTRVKDGPLPVGRHQFLFVVRIWDAFKFVEHFDLPITTALLTTDVSAWEAWFKSIPNETYLNPPITGYEKLINVIKGN